VQQSTRRPFRAAVPAAAVVTLIPRHIGAEPLADEVFALIQRQQDRFFARLRNGAS
jgi:hypothetical protein